ncbi:tetratricopeptide repeat protein [Bacillus halotolerans]|uniref:tetratricopeptide repeat protein n=2 Tax=Bacillus halotolerans TaxID=260554 RepID=UPI0015E61B16|nr:tetratricopeptide repeat protein [Bacillus halotolerans]
MKITIPPINLGRLIFLNRIKKGMTQDQLSKSICSIPYLSKLENNKLNPSEDILYHLLKRLDIEIEKVQNEYKELIYVLEQWYQSIIIKDNHLVDYYKKKARNYQRKKLPPDLSNFVQLLEIRCALYVKDIDAASKNILNLQKVQKNMSAMVWNYFTYFKGILDCMKSNYFRAKSLFLEVEQGFISEKANPIPELYYHLAFVNSQLHDISMAIYYAENAKYLFTQQLKYNRIIECELIIGINLTRQERYIEAREKFETIVNMCKLNKCHHLCAKGLHNLAYLESQLGNNRDAIKLYEESLLFKEENENSYLNTLLHLSEEHLKLNEKEEAYKVYNKVIAYYSTYNLSKEYYYKAKVEKLKFDGKIEELITLLEEEVIPYFEEINNVIYLSKIFYVTADLFEKKRKYKKSSEYYQKAYRLLSMRKGVI